MNKLTHAAAKKVFSGIADYAIGQVHKNPEEAYTKIIDTAEKTYERFWHRCKLGLSQTSSL